MLYTCVKVKKKRFVRSSFEHSAMDTLTKQLYIINKLDDGVTGCFI